MKLLVNKLEPLTYSKLQGIVNNDSIEGVNRLSFPAISKYRHISWRFGFFLLLPYSLFIWVWLLYDNV